MGPADNLVVDVGKISDPGDVQAAPAQVAHQDLEDHTGAGVAQVAVVINRDAAGIKPHFSRPQGLEGFLASA